MKVAEKIAALGSEEKEQLEDIVEMLKRIVNERREKRRRLAEAIDRVWSDEENPHE